MAHPEGYAKAMRVMALADRFGFPVVTLVDTPGAYPGLAAEQHGQGGAIARSQATMLRLGVPTVACIIGEGGSGGAIALAVADRVLMQENAIYSVISPEGCALILWRDGDEAKKAAGALKPDARHCLELGVIDGIVPEPEGGAQNDHDEAARAAQGRARRRARGARGRARRGAAARAAREVPHDGRLRLSRGFRASPQRPQSFQRRRAARRAESRACGNGRDVFHGRLWTTTSDVAKLEDYKRKRDPKRTPEPFGGSKRGRASRSS